MENNVKKEIPSDYYKMYEDRYQRIYKHGIERWAPDALVNELNVFIDIADIKKGMKGIDLGCGEGTNTIYLAHNGMIMTGVDLSTTGLNCARKFAKKEKIDVEFVQDDALVLSHFRDDSFDFGICTGCLHMLVKQSDRDKLFQQVKRVLKPNGMFFLLNRGDGINGEYPDTENYLDTREWKWVDKEGKILDVLKLPLLPCWSKNWEDHLKEIKDNGFEVVHHFESCNKSFNESMCVIIKLL